jgi:S-DNA-T family DNA segregation ATPase FtsK/SpoIIIE
VIAKPAEKPYDNNIRDAAAALTEAARLASDYRVELAVIVPTAFAWWLVAHDIGAILAAILVAIILTALALITGPQRVLRVLWRARVRRRFIRACRLVNVRVHARHVQRVSAGAHITAWLPRGATVDTIARHAGSLASAMNARTVTVHHDPTHARRALVFVRYSDPLGTAEPIAWPLADAATVNLWDPIPVGLDEHGHTATVDLAGGPHVLLGGQSGSGKSVTLGLLYAAAAVGNARMIIIDGGMVDGALWSGCAETYVGADVEAAETALRRVQAIVDERQAELVRRGQQKVTADDADWAPMVTVFVDELPYFTAAAKEKKSGQAGHQFTELCRDLVARGRKTGVFAILSAQKPTTDTVPSSVRDNTGVQLALRSRTEDASDSILGKGTAALGFNAARLPSTAPGVGFLQDAVAGVRLIRTCFLSTDSIRAIAGRVEDIRLDHEHAQALEDASPVDTESTTITP